MNRTAAVFLALLVAASLTQAAPATPKVGESFTTARKQLYAAGWRADPLAHLSSGGFMGLERQLVENGYAEVDSCSEGLSFSFSNTPKAMLALGFRRKGSRSRG